MAEVERFCGVILLFISFNLLNFITVTASVCWFTRPSLHAAFVKSLTALPYKAMIFELVISVMLISFGIYFDSFLFFVYLFACPRWIQIGMHARPRTHTCKH